MEMTYGHPNRSTDRTNNDELLKAHAHIWNHIFNFINSMSLKCAIQLGIFDAVHRHGRPISLPDLTAALTTTTTSTIHPEKAQSSCLPRLLQKLVHSGFLASNYTGEKTGDDDVAYYSLTHASRLLLKDTPTSLTPFLSAMLDPILTDPWHFMGDWFRTGGGGDPATPFEMAHGRTLWDYAGAEPRLNRFFNEAMASDARFVMSVVLGECREVFEGLRSLVDVGGGTGAVAGAVVAVFPEVECTVLDLPHVIDGLEDDENLKFVGGDMFEAIPPANAVLLKWILHDWSDKACVKILKKCKEAIPGRKEGGKLIIIEMLMHSENDQNKEGEEDWKHHHESVETQLFFDMLMMALVSGKERNEKEWAKLFSEAGFSDYKITPILGLRAIIEVYP